MRASGLTEGSGRSKVAGPHCLLSPWGAFLSLPHVSPTLLELSLVAICWLCRHAPTQVGLASPGHGFQSRPLSELFQSDIAERGAHSDLRQVFVGGRQSSNSGGGQGLTWSFLKP